MISIIRTILAVSAAWTVSAETLRHYDFEANDWSPGYPVYFARGAAQPGEIFLSADAHSGNQSLAVFTPDAWSWGFFINSFAPGELKGKTLRAGCWMKTSNPRTSALVLTEGFVYGEAGIMMKFAYPKEANRWEFVSVEWPVQDAAHHRFSVGVGHDYGAEKSWTIIDDLIIECGDNLPPLAEFPPQPSDRTDRRVLGALRNVAGEVEQVLSDLSTCPPATWPAGFDLETTKRNVADLCRGETTGLIGLDQLRELEQLLNTARQWQLGIAVSVDTLAAPDPSQQLPVEEPVPVALGCAANQHKRFLVLLRNRSARPQEVQLKLDGIPDAAVIMRRTVEVSGGADYMPLLRNADSLPLSSGATTMVLVEIDGAQLPDGTHDASLQLIPFSPSLVPVAVPLRITRYPVELPAQASALIFNWDYNSANDVTPTRLKMLLNAGINFFNIDHLDENCENPDFSVIGRWVENFRRIAGPDYRFQLQLETSLIRNHGGWKPEFNPWLDKLVAATEHAGLKYEDWNLHIYDETLSDEFLDAARQIKAYNPNIRIFSDKAEPNSERMRQFASVVDYWCPLVPTLNDTQYDSSYAVMRESGHPIMMYLCEPTPTSSLVEYRLMPWRTWHYGLQGFGYWAFLPNRQRQQDAAPNYGFFYQDSEGFSPSRRWLEWENGIDDYRLLETAARYSPQGRQMADQAAAEICAAAQANRPVGELIESWRVQLLEAIR